MVLFNRQTKQARKEHAFCIYDYSMHQKTNTEVVAPPCAAFRKHSLCQSKLHQEA